MKKIYEKIMKYRRPIGYTIGTINILNGLADLALGFPVWGILWVILGALIIADAKYSP
jgi:hypothetical protein